MDDGGTRVDRRGQQLKGINSPKRTNVSPATRGGLRCLGTRRRATVAMGRQYESRVERDHLESLLIELVVAHPCHRSYVHVSGW